MLIAFGPLVENAAGSTGSITVQQTLAGPVLRSHTIPIDPATTAQLLQRASLTNISQLWKSSAMVSYRAAWILLAIANPYTNQFGQTQRLTGSALFNKLNRNLATIGVSSILVAPGSLACGNPGTITPTYTPGSSPTMVISSTTNPAGGEAVVIRSTKPLSAGISAIGQTQTIVQTFAPGTAGPWDISTTFNKKYGKTFSDQNCYILVNYVNSTTGFAGTMVDNQVAL